MLVKVTLALVYHHAKHDIKSFYQVLLFITLEYNGPHLELLTRSAFLIKTNHSANITMALIYTLTLTPKQHF